MTWLEPKYALRKSWGHTVSLKDPYFEHAEFSKVVDTEAVDAILEWAIENANGTRISYDTWKFETQQSAEEFIMLFRLRYGR
jgi:hypothetical protein